MADGLKKPVDTERLGPMLLVARATNPPVSWKTLQTRHGLSRTRLYEIWRAELVRRREVAEIDFGEILANIARIECSLACSLEDLRTAVLCAIDNKDVQ